MRFSRGSLVTKGDRPFFLFTFYIDEWRLARLQSQKWMFWVALGPIRVGWSRK